MDTNFCHLPKDIQRVLLQQYFDPLSKVRCFQTGKIFWDLFKPRNQTLELLRRYQVEAVRDQILTRQQQFFEEELAEYSQKEGIPKEELKRCSKCNRIMLVRVEEKDCKCQTSWVPFGFGLSEMTTAKHCDYCGCRFIGGRSPHTMQAENCELHIRPCHNNRYTLRDYPEVEPCQFSSYRLRLRFHEPRCQVKCTHCNLHVPVKQLVNHCKRDTHSPDPWICRSKTFACWWQCGVNLPINRLIEHERSCSNTLMPCKSCRTQMPRHRLIGRVCGKVYRCDGCTCNNPFEIPRKPLAESGEISSTLAGKLFRQGLENYSRKQNLTPYNRR